MRRLLLISAAILVPLAAVGQEAGAPLALTVKPLPSAQPPRDRLEEMIARREEAARRLQIGICRGCLRTEPQRPAGAMIEVSVEHPRASWEVPAR